MNRTSILSFLRRYWWVVLVLVASIWLVFSPGAFRLLDLFVYLPAAFGVSYGLPLLWGDYARWYRDLDPKTRVILVSAQWVGYVIAAAIIVAGFLVFLSGIPPRI